MPKTIAEVSADTIRLEAILSALPVGGRVDYTTLSEAVGRDVRTRGRGLLSSARRRLLREKSMVFGCEPGEGVRRLGDVEMIGHGANVVQRVRRASRRGMAVVLAVENFDALSTEDRVRHNTTALLLGSIAVMTGRPGQRKITGKVVEAHRLTEQEIKAIAESI